MSKTTREYLQDMISYLDKVATFTQEGYTHFEIDERTQFAVIRAYEVIGEIVKRLPDELRTSNNHIDWRRLSGFRDFLAHNYDELVLELVWAAVEDIPRLKAAIEKLLETNNEG